MSALSAAKDFVFDKIQRRPRLLLEDEESVQGKTVVITGANSGIGKVAAAEFAWRGATVVMACRDTEKAKLVMAEIQEKYPDATLILVELDLGDLSSVRKCAEEIRSKCKEIHILVNNAGCLYTSPPITTTKHGFEVHLGTNYLGHFLLTNLLLDVLKASAPSRIVFVGSSLHRIAQLDLDDLMLTKTGYFGVRNFGPYANSKLAILYYATELNERVKGSGVNIYTLCPGYVKTDAFRNESCFNSALTKTALFFMGTTPEEAVETVMYCSISKSLEKDSGKMYHFNRHWDKVNKDIENFDRETLSRLWSISEELTSENRELISN